MVKSSKHLFFISKAPGALSRQNTVTRILLLDRETHIHTCCVFLIITSIRAMRFKHVHAEISLGTMTVTSIQAQFVTVILSAFFHSKNRPPHISGVGVAFSLSTPPPLFLWTLQPVVDFDLHFSES